MQSKHRSMFRRRVLSAAAFALVSSGMLAGDRAGGIRVTGLGDDLDVGLAVQHQTESAANDGVVIRENYGDPLWRHLP